MRNLQVRSVVIRDTWLSSAKHGVQNELLSDEIEAVCLSVEDKIFCACLGGVYELSSEVPRLVEWRKERNGAKIVSFDHLSDEYLLCAVLSSGRVLVVDYENEIIEQYDVVQVEICSARWAPDYHVLLLASSRMLYFVSRQFDIMNEQPLNSRRAGREELTTIGWGSKETQFQGVSGRKQSRNDESEQQPTVVGDCDKGRILLAWNGDANYVVVSYVESETSLRHFCVFDHEGELISYLQQANNVEETVAYKPTGNLIATSRHKGDEREIIFYERNGQRRSKFQHGLHRGTIIDWMGWNNDGNIFCVQSTLSETATQEDYIYTSVDFWCVSNYDWMLKYRILNDNGFLLTCWHESNPNLFCYVTRDGRIAFIDFDFIYNFCDEIILSTSGCNVRVTDLEAASIPPPMCHYELTFPHIVCEIAQFSGGAAFLLADRSLFAYKLRERKLEKYAEYDTIDLPKGCICYNLCLGDSDRLTAIVASSFYGLYSFSFKNENRGKSTCLYSSEVPFIWHNYINDGFVLQRIDGKWFSIKKYKDESSQCLEPQKFFEVESTLRCCRYLSKKDTIFGINKTNDLVMNGRSILKYVGSYTIDKNYLLAITSSRSVASQLQLIRIEDILDGKKINWKISRAVERGAMLIGHEARGARVWLQMPRGNLETIYSRGLLLRNLKELLTGLHFKDAAVMMKKHRIDMNLFYDHDPEFFMEHIGRFVEDVGCAELLNLFVTSLNNDDTTLGIYSKNYDNSNNNKRLNKTVIKNEGTKVQNVCTAIREYILSRDDSIVTDLYTTVLSTYLREQPSQVSKALSALREQSLKLPHGSKFENKWITFVSLLAPQENLFNAALSTYDLDLALADPKEYLPLIMSFQSQSPLAYRKSKIDLYLGRFQRAVQNLSELDDHWNESAEIIKRHNLYAEALVAYRGKKTYLKTCELCATYLASKRRFEEAALLFRRANNMAQAQECYQNAQNWKQVVKCGQIMGMERDAINGLLQNIIPHLENKGKFVDIAEILSFIDKKYNRTQIVEYYCKADAWDSAINFAFGDEELTEIVSKKASLRCEQILQNVESWGTLLEQYCCRLEVVRQNKKSSLSEAIRRFTGQDISISDMFSEASVTGSDISKISAASTASARRRKHIEKKKKLLKEGSQYEDAALLNAVKDIVSLIDSQQNELVLLLPALIAVDAVEEARTLQTHFQTLIKRTQKIIEIAWPTCLPLHAIPGPLREIVR
uniref:Elongator complex protein 1 n=1 Tax=Setaria digitata TaxID=48799 RepID=A0A915Q691_9BILA